jgi:hypothetical protein
MPVSGFFCEAHISRLTRSIQKWQWNFRLKLYEENSVFFAFLFTTLAFPRLRQLPQGAAGPRSGEQVRRPLLLLHPSSTTLIDAAGDAKHTVTLLVHTATLPAHTVTPSVTKALLNKSLDLLRSPAVRTLLS